MLLLTTDPKLAKPEAELRQWYRDKMGEKDADDLVRFFWEKHGGGPEFLEVLAGVCRASEKDPGLLGRLLYHAQRPAEKRDADAQLRAFVQAHLQRMADSFRRFGDSDEVKVKERERFSHAVMEYVHKTWPRKHQATVRGAILSALQVRGGKIHFVVSELVDAMFMNDPLEENSAASWA